MTEKIAYIPARLRSAAKGGFVTGAEDVMDDRLGMSQQRVNEALENGINALDSQGYEHAEATEQTTDVTDLLPATGEKNKLYQVSFWDGEQYNTNAYAQYTWDGEQYKLMSVKNPGIDEEPKDGSGNLAKSGGIKRAFNGVHKNIGGINLVNPTEWEQGAISSADGTNTTTHANYRIRTTDVQYTHNDMKVTLPQGMSVYVFLYESDETFIESNGWLESATIMAGSYYRLVLAYDTADTHPETTITVDDLQYVNMGVTALYETGSKVYDAVLNFNVVLDSQKIIGRYIAAGDLLWHKKTTTYSADGVIVDVRRFKGQVVRLFNETISFYYAALIDDSHAVDDMPTYANLDKRKAVAANTVEELLISGNINYLYIVVHNTSGDLVYPDVDIIGKVNYQNEKVIEHDSDIKEIQTSVFDTEIEEGDVPVVSRYINSKTKKWGSSTTAKGVMIDVSSYHGRSISFENKNENKAYFAELADNDTTPGTTPSYTTPDQRKYVNPDTKVVIKVANETNYIYVSSVSTNGDDIFPVVTILSSIVAEVGEVVSVPLIYKNVQKKAAQLQYLTWFAKAPISNNITEGEHVGMIYSSCVEIDRYLFYDISLKSFMTSVNNPYSLLYTEHLEQDHHASGYGFTYYTNRNTGRAYMGTVCSRLTGYTSGLPIEYDTAYMYWLCKEGIFTAIDDQTAQGVEIGDWTWISGHVRIVTNVEKEDGVVTSVTVTEAWIPLCRALTLSPTAFNNYITNNNGIIYRYNKLHENVVYQPSEFVNVEDEPSPSEYEYNNDICTYAGDKAAFYEGFPIWLNYNLDSEETYSWTHIKLYKESWSRANVLTTELIGTYEIDAAEHKYQLPELEYGLYRACMTDGENDSDFTYFEVIQVNEHVTDEGSGVKRVDFSSPNGTPVRVVFCQIDGTPMAIRDLSYDDRLNGYVTMNPEMLCSLQRRQTLPSEIYLRVYVVGKYGRVSRQITMDNERFINWE